MGKKTKKTKWRTLEISLPVSGKNYHENGPNLQQLDDGWRTSYSYDKYRRSNGYDKIIKASACDAKSSSGEENHAKAQIEDEYTKITTPRQDVLFKKGYLTRRKTPRHTCDENIADSFASNETVNLGGIQAQADCASVGDQEFCDYASITTDGGSCLSTLSSVQPQSHSQQLLCATSQPYMDASTAAIYYGGGYGIYDPYTGSVTALVVGATSTANSPAATAAAASCQPILTSMSCRPVPLQSLQWFNPVPSSSEWCCDANATTTANAAVVDDADDDADANAGDDDSITKASHFDDCTNSNKSASASEASPMAENTILKTDVDVPVYSPHPSQSYIYPSYVFETAVYSVEDDGGTNIRYYSPESPILSSNESAFTKRKKRRKRHRRFGETEEDSESGVEENHDEYVFSCQNQVVDYAYDEYKDNDELELAATVDVQNQTNCSSFGSQSTLRDDGGLHYTSLPRASINAPPFVPANRVGGHGGAQTPLSAEDSSRCRSSDQYVEVDEVETKSPSSTSINAVVDSKMRRKSFVDGRSKSQTDSPSSSNNSDSGISSPGIEDCPSVGQLHEYSNSVQADRSRTADITPVTQNSGDCDYAAIVTAAAATTAAVTAAALSSDDKTNICDSSCARDDKPSKKIRAKSSSNRVKRCHSKNEERNLKRSVSGRELHAQIDESVDCAPSIAVCDQDPQSPAENRSKKPSNVETTPQIEQVADDENWTAGRGSCDDCSIVDDNSETIENKCASASETHSSPKEENCRDKCENALARTRVAHPPEEAQNDASSRPRHHLFENHAEICDQTDACFAHTVTVLSDQLDQNDATAWSPKTNVDASKRASQDRSVSENVNYSSATVECRSEHVAKAARIIVDEIVQQAESQIRMSTTKCDTLPLPLTQAVTNWLNECGGLPGVVDGFQIQNHCCQAFPRQPPSDESADAETTASRRSQSKKPAEKSTASSSKCVIC